MVLTDDGWCDDPGDPGDPVGPLLVEPGWDADVVEAGAALDPALAAEMDLAELCRLRDDPPGPWSVVALSSLGSGGLTAAGREVSLQAWERQVSWVTACQVRAVAAVAGPPPEPDPEAPAWADPGDLDEREAAVGTLLGISPGSAAHRVALARELTGRLAPTLAALAAGELTMRHVHAVRDAVHDLDDGAAAAVQARVLPGGAGASMRAFCRRLRRAVAAVDPVLDEVAGADAVAQRRVSCTPLAHGMAEIYALLPAADAQAVMSAIDAVIARGDAGGAGDPRPAEEPTRAGGDAGAEEHRSPEARRADALAALCRWVLTDPALPRRHGRPIAVQVTIDLATLLGLAERPGELAGYGPIPAAAARALAADGTWHRLVTDPVTGHTLDYGHTTYTPPQALRDYLLARDGTCRFPGCPIPAERSDLDHIVPYGKGGPTSAANMTALCRRHHRLKTHTRWQTSPGPDNTLVWTSPTGASYLTEPARPPTTTLDA